MPETDLDLLIRAAREAGAIALRYAGGPLDVIHKEDGAGPVTDADHAVNDHLHALLRGARPGYGWLSEETPDDPARLSCDRVFILDPIDGTRSFIEGSGTWAHSIAVAEQGRVVAAVVYLPARDRLYAAVAGAGATANGTSLCLAGAPDLHRAKVLATRPSMEPVNWRGAVPTFQRHHRPSIAYRLCLVAEGRFDAMLTFRPTWEWDIAAGALILQEAGAGVSDRTGAALQFNSADPRTAGIVAAAPALHRQILDHLAF